jgi:hypothetical protein
VAEAYLIQSGSFDVLFRLTNACAKLQNFMTFSTIMLVSGRMPLRKPWYRWEDNIREDLWDIGCEDRNWMEQVQDRVNSGLLTCAPMPIPCTVTENTFLFVSFQKTTEYLHIVCLILSNF